MKINKTDLIDLIQCYYRTRDCSDYHILKRSDKIVDDIAQKYGYPKPKYCISRE